MVSKVRGTFDTFSGAITIAEEACPARRQVYAEAVAVIPQRF